MKASKDIKENPIKEKSENKNDPEKVSAKTRIDLDQGKNLARQINRIAAALNQESPDSNLLDNNYTENLEKNQPQKSIEKVKKRLCKPENHALTKKTSTSNLTETENNKGKKLKQEVNRNEKDKKTQDCFQSGNNKDSTSMESTNLNPCIPCPVTQAKVYERQGTLVKAKAKLKTLDNIHNSNLEFKSKQDLSNKKL